MGASNRKGVGYFWGFLFLTVCFFPGDAGAEIISPGRRTIWQGNVGVQGGIPDRSVIYQTLKPGATGAEINKALANCPNGQVVLLSAGTYRITDGPINLTKSNITLRGAGSSQTKLVFSGFSGWAYINMKGSGFYQPSPVTNWTGGYSQGSTVLTVASSSGLSVGALVELDQKNDPNYIDKGDEGATSLGNDTSGGHLQMQLTEIKAINGNQVTISPGVYMPNWSGSFAPRLGVYSQGGQKIVNSGIEDLYFEGASPNTSCEYNMDIDRAQNCWLKNIDSANSQTAQVYIFNTKNCEIRRSHFGSNRVEGPGSYGVLSILNCQMLIEDNIFDGGANGQVGPLLTEMGTAGSVIAYNFLYHVSTANNTGSLFGNHNPHPSFNLFEGNIAPQIAFDSYHGSSSHSTVFRNALAGSDGSNGAGPQGATTGNAHAINIAKYNRYCNVIGNVLGTNGINNYYEQSSASPRGTDQAIYKLGYSSSNYFAPADAMVYKTLLRHGNFDVVNGSTLWDPAIPDHTLPPSLYLSSKPSWWGPGQWPSIGPDLSPMNGGNPAMLRFQQIAKASAAAPTDLKAK